MSPTIKCPNVSGRAPQGHFIQHEDVLLMIRNISSNHGSLKNTNDNDNDIEGVKERKTLTQ